MKTEYHSSKIGALVRLTASLIKEDPSLVDNFQLLKAKLFREFPELANKKVCANCQASMKEYTFMFDALDAKLLLRMAEDVRGNLNRGLSFSDANKVRVQRLDTSHSIKCRTTIASKLGLITQLTNTETKKNIPGVWLITKRGWQALRGEQVPKMVKVWRGGIEERFDEMTTLSEAIANLPDVDKNVYKPEDWYAVTLHEGVLF